MPAPTRRDPKIKTVRHGPLSRVLRSRHSHIHVLRAPYGVRNAENNKASSGAPVFETVIV
jgi:hypothetical protein